MSTGISTNDKNRLHTLLQKAVSNYTSKGVGKVGNSGKAFEIYCLALILRLLRKKSYQLDVKNAGADNLRLPGGPCIPDKAVHTYFTATNEIEELEIWVSVEFMTLSSHLFGGALTGNTNKACSFYHEIDVAVYKSGIATKERPSYKDLVLGASCKYVTAQKEQVREALGIRRETAYYHAHSMKSKAPWFIDYLHADPAVPIVLFSRDPGISAYTTPIDIFGIYLRHLKFRLVP